MIDLTVPETGMNSTSSLWEEPYFPALISSGIVLPPCSPDPPLAGAQLTRRKGKKKKVKVKKEEFLTMTKFFFKNYRLTMYSHLNDLRRSGRLKHLVGFDFQTQVINRQALEIMNPTYWKITREMFEADVPFDLTLQTEFGPRTWHGCFVFYFWVEDSGIHGTIEDCCAVEDIPDHADQQMLSPFLVPYQKGWMIDREGENLWKRHYDGTVPKEDDRNALDLAKRMGLTIRYEAVDKDDGVGSILFFKKGRLLVKERNAPAKEKPKEVTIPAKTIVINTNIIKKEYSWFDIYHECYHYETHYAFYVLQQMGCNDLREMDDLVIEVDEEEKVSNPIYWIETQANRGAYALMMPVTEMRELTRQELAKVQNPKHRGDLYQQAGESIARILHKPHFRIRARLIQLGHIHARGALNYVDGSPIEPFDFDDEAWKEDNCTFIIDRYHSGKIYAKNKDYQTLLDTGKFVYADGHIVRNAPEYVTWDKERHILTPWAYRNVDQCCLRFMKEYKLKNIGRYIRGRLNYDAAYATQMEFYMRDIINQKQLELDEAKQEYIRTFPETFHDAFTMLRQQNNVSMEDAEELFRVSQSTLNRWLDNPEEKISIDFIMFISLTWKLPDFITDLLFELAHKSLSMRDPRHVLFRHILRVEWEDGVEKANEHLQWESVVITITYEEAVSVPSVSSTSVNMGSAVTVYTNRVSTNTTHTLLYSFGNASGTIATNVGVSVSWTPSLSLASQIPNATSGICIITCQSYNGGTLTGSRTCTLTLNVLATIVPSISSVTVTDTNTTVDEKIGSFVKLLSTLSVSITAVGANGSTISSYRTSLDGVNYTTASFTANRRLSTAGDMTMTVVVTDSRGRTATHSTTFSVLDYAYPSIRQFKAERCNSDGSDTQVDGTKVRYSFQGSVSALSNKNALSCVVYYKLTSASAWTIAETMQITSYNVSAADKLLSQTYDALASYDLKVRLSDYFYYVEQAVSIGTKGVIMDILADGTGIAFGKVAEESGHAEFGWPLKLSSPLAIQYGGTGAATAAAALAALDAVKKSGDTMTGNLTIQSTLYPSVYLKPTHNDTANRTVFEGSYLGASSFASWEDAAGNNRRMLEVRTKSYENSLDNAVMLRVADNGIWGNYRVFHAGMPTPVPVANGGTGANNAATARSNLGANNASNLTAGTLPMARLPFKIAYGSGSVSGSSALTINYSSAGFTSVPCVIVTYSTTGSNWSGDNGALKVYSKTTTGATIIVGGSFNSARNVDWVAVGQ